MSEAAPAPPSTSPLASVLERFRRAAIEQSAEQIATLYAPDAVHEFPFTRPGVPARIAGRGAIVAFMQASWDQSPLRYRSYRTLALFEPDERTLIVEQWAEGFHAVNGSTFALPNIAVLTIENGLILNFRDYVNLLAVAETVRP